MVDDVDDGQVSAVAERIILRRVYDEPGADEGHRVLVDRLWPRGVSRERAAIDEWLRDIAPSDELRQWYRHDPARWDEFQQRYRAELEPHAGALADLAGRAMVGPVTLVFASKEERLNNAAALRRMVLERIEDLGR